VKSLLTPIRSAAAIVVIAAACSPRESRSTATPDSTAGAPGAAATEQAGEADSVRASANESTRLDVTVDPRLPAYTRVDSVSGVIRSIGSDTMNNLMALWTEDFKAFYPNVQVEIEGQGSSTAPPALIQGTANFGPMSRPMRGNEVDEFRQVFGYEPTLMPTAVDMLALFVHKDNPIEGLTVEQVDAIFSKGRRGGYDFDIVRWGDLGLTGEWADKTISLYGRNSASGTYGFFKSNAIFGGDFKDSVKEQPGSSAVVSGIAKDRFAIGYSGIGYKTADVRVVPLMYEGDEQFFPGEPRHAYSGAYPLARFLIVYMNYEPGTELDPLRREFVRFLYSRDGQADIVEDGYLPLPAVVARDAAAKVGVRVELLDAE